MSGPVSLALGPFAFEAMGFGYTDTQHRLETPWAALDVVGRLNALQWTGPRGDTITLRGVLFPEAFGGLSTLAGLREAALAGSSQILVSIGGLIHGRFVIEGVGEERGFIDRTGQPRRDAFTIDLRRHADSGGGSLGSLLGLF